MNLTILKGELYVIAVATPAGRFKLFQIKCKPDGTILVPFPYYEDPSAQLIEGTLKANQTYSEGLTVCGPVAGRNAAEVAQQFGSVDYKPPHISAESDPDRSTGS